MSLPSKATKTLQVRSKMPIGMHKGFTIDYLIKHNPDYLLYMRKRGWIKLSTDATTRLLWAIADKRDDKIVDSEAEGSLL